MKVMAEDWATETSDAFRNERSPAGDPWPELAPSTLKKRAAKLPGAKRRSKKTGKLTKAARNKRKAGLVAGSGLIRMLVDNGLLRNATSYRVGPSGQSVNIQGVEYLEPHVTGSIVRKGHPPKRNPLVIDRDAMGYMALIPRAHKKLTEAISHYVATGKVS